MKNAGKIAAIIALMLGCGVLSFKLGKTFLAPTNAEAQKHVVLLRFKAATCSGVEIISPKGKPYIITAAHCFSQDETEASVVQGEDKTTTVGRVVLSKKLDLGVLRSVSDTGLRLAWDVTLPSDAHTMSYTILPSTGRMGPYYRNGQVVTYSQNGDLCNPLWLDRYPSACNLFIVGTMHVTPGNSGGALLDTANDLIGIISSFDSLDFSYHVRLEDIRKILKEADEI